MRFEAAIELFPCRQPSKRIKRYDITTSYGAVDFLVKDKHGIPIGVDSTIDLKSRVEISQSNSGVVYVMLGNPLANNVRWFSTVRRKI